MWGSRNFHRGGGGVQMLINTIGPIGLVIFQGGGVLTPYPPLGSRHAQHSASSESQTW